MDDHPRAELSGPTLLAAAIVAGRNDLLVVRRSGVSVPERWSVPTAVVRSGEMLVEAAVRAVEECTGIPAVSGAFIGWYEAVPPGPDDAGHRVVMCFTVVPMEETEPVPGPGLDEARWMPVWDVSELPLVDGLAELLADTGITDTIT